MKILIRVPRLVLLPPVLAFRHELPYRCVSERVWCEEYKVVGWGGVGGFRAMHTSRAPAPCQVLCTCDLHLVVRRTKDRIYRRVGVGGIASGHPDLGAVHDRQPDR